MSADNYLSLREYQDRKGRFYLLTARTSSHQLIEPIGKFTNLREALIAAEEYQQANEVEYGLSFFPITD
jgi:hypothetical protein